jgi:hypothetical protein
MLGLGLSAPQANAIPVYSEVSIDGSFTYDAGGAPAFGSFTNVRVSANPNNTGIFDSSVLPYGTPVMLDLFNYETYADDANFRFTDSLGNAYVIHLDSVLDGLPPPPALFLFGDSTLSGSGIATESFADSYVFTINSASSTAFSATFYFTPAVPDGGSTLILLSGGLLGLGLFKRLQARA